jgi:hypothetical protein
MKSIDEQPFFQNGHFWPKTAIFKSFSGRHVYRSSNPFFDNENWLMGKRADLLSFAEELFEFGNLRMKAPFAFDPRIHLWALQADAGEKLFREAARVAEEIDAVPNRTGQSGDALLFDVFFRRRYYQIVKSSKIGKNIERSF